MAKIEIVDRRGTNKVIEPAPTTADASPPTMPRGDLAPDIKPHLRHLDAAVGVPFGAWASREHAHRVVLRHETLSLLKAFVEPLQDELARQRAMIGQLRRPWYVKLWHWLRAPVARPEPAARP